MLKKVVLVLLVLSVVLSARNMIRMKKVEQAPTKQEAVQNAYWFMFEDAMDKVLGSSSYGGNVIDSFKSDMNKDFLEFKKEHYRNPKEKCNNLGENGYECMVMASIDIDKLKYKVSEKSNSSSTMGKDGVEDIEIVLIDNVATKLSKRFTKEVHASSKETGTNLRVEKKGTPIGKKGNRCKALKKQQKLYKRKGASYQAALDAVEVKLDACENNTAVNYVFTLDELDVNIDEYKDRYGSYTGELTYNISMINTQTGKEDNAIRSETVSSFADSLNKLKSKLNKKAAIKINSEMTSNLLKTISKSSRTKSKSARVEYEFYNTIIVRGVTSDKSDRKKLKMVRSAVKSLKAKAKRNSKESAEFEQVYNFGTDEEIDPEDFADILYDNAEAAGFNINVSDEGDNITLVQFQ